jgi:hypothetical protein
MERYVLVYEKDHDDFAREVNRLLALGYEPHGNTFQADTHKHWVMAQAMLLPKELLPEPCATCGKPAH